VAHSAQERKLVGVARGEWEEFVDKNAVNIGADCLAPRTGEIGTGGGLRVEGVEVRRTAGEEDLDDGFGGGGAGVPWRGAKPRRQELGEGGGTDGDGSGAQKIAARLQSERTPRGTLGGVFGGVAERVGANVATGGGTTGGGIFGGVTVTRVDLESVSGIHERGRMKVEG
jgi:hypothetical protein